VKVALTVAGSDSGGGAGIQADLKVFAAYGLHGTSALTAVTAQNSMVLAESFLLPAKTVVAQIEAVAQDMTVAAAKTGMLGSVEILEAVAEALRRLKLPHLVVDPVMVSKSGARLFPAGAERAYLDKLLPLTSVFTPNLPEAEVLLGRRIQSLEEMGRAARSLREWGAQAVVVKGGHRKGDPVDLFFDGQRLEELAASRIPTDDTHGSGCTFSAAIAAKLALGASIPDAVAGAKAFVSEAIRRSYRPGSGPGPVDPLFGLHPPH